MEGIPIDRDLAVANPEEAPEVDDRSTHLPALIDDHVDDPPHILSGAAADLPAQHRIVLFEHRGGHFGRSPTACLIPRGFGCLGESLQWRAPRIISGGRHGRSQRYGRDNGCCEGNKTGHEPTADAHDAAELPVSLAYPLPIAWATARHYHCALLCRGGSRSLTVQGATPSGHRRDSKS